MMNAISYQYSYHMFYHEQPTISILKDFLKKKWHFQEEIVAPHNHNNVA